MHGVCPWNVVMDEVGSISASTLRCSAFHLQLEADVWLGCAGGLADGVEECE